MTQTHRINSVISALIVVLLLLLVFQSFRLQQAATQTVLLGVLAGLLAVIVMQSARWASGNSVEYKMVEVGSIDEPTLQQFGKDGWRLICFDATGARYIFTR